MALLAKLDEVAVVVGGDDPAPAGVGVVGAVEIFLPMTGLVDLDKERERLDKELAKIEGWIRGCRAKLANEKFVANAPAAVVEQQRGPAGGERGRGRDPARSPGRPGPGGGMRPTCGREEADDG